MVPISLARDALQQDNDKDRIFFLNVNVIRDEKSVPPNIFPCDTLHFPYFPYIYHIYPFELNQRNRCKLLIFSINSPFKVLRTVLQNIASNDLIYSVPCSNVL